MPSLKALRKQCGLTQAELAARAGLRQATLSALENGHSQPHAGTILALARAMAISEGDVCNAVRETRGEGRAPSDAMEALRNDWPFLAGLDSDLRAGLARALVAEWTHSSTALEGNTISAGDTLFVLTEGLTVSGKSLREHQELHGHAQALSQLIGWIRSRRSIQFAHLHELHRAVQTGAVIDIYAPVGAWKVEPNGTTVITSKGTTCWHDYALPRDVPRLVEMWRERLAEICRDPLLRRGRQEGDEGRRVALIDAYTDVHLGFVGIHPYADGNGRLARLLANIPLLRAGCPPLLVSAEQRREYLMLLGDYTLARGPVAPDEQLIMIGKERDSLRAFFSDQWEATLALIESFVERQRTRDSA